MSEAADAMVLAMPAAQAIALGASHSAVIGQARSAVMAPCWSTMLALDAASARSSTKTLPADVLRVSATPAIARAWRESAKAGRPPLGCWVVQSDSEWSAAHLDDDATLIGAEVALAFASAIGATRAPVHVQAHRWRYATVKTPADMPCLWDDAMQLGPCGDWCNGDGVEGAWRSGLALSDRIARDIG